MNNLIAVSTWSLHGALGFSFLNGPASRAPFAKENTWGQGQLSLLELPTALAAHGYYRCEVCHFHIGDLSDVALRALREAFQKSSVIIQTLLIDDGDITNSATSERDMAWIKTWIDAAVLLGAENVRVIAGKSTPTTESLARSVISLKELVRYGTSQGIRVVTENWFDLLSKPEAVHHVLDVVGPELGFMADTGNWHGPTKYSDLQSIFARANLCHAKASFDENQALDETDFRQCLAAAKAANYEGPLTLIFDGAGDEWMGLEKIRQSITQY